MTPGNRADEAIAVADEIRKTKFPQALVIFAAGSIVRGEGTPYSDIDLVVVMPGLKNAWRESFIHRGFPVEVFVHTRETLLYVFDEVDAKAGSPALSHMVMEGVPLPETALARELKKIAKTVFDRVPPPLTGDDVRTRRYFITDLVDDLRAIRTRAEGMATATRLYEMLADFYLRANGHWTARGKSSKRG